MENKDEEQQLNMAKRIMNIRPLFVFFVSVMFGIAFMYSLQNAIWKATTGSVLIFSCIYAVLLLTCFILCFVYKSTKEYKNRFSNIAKNLSKHKVAIVGGLCCFIIGIGCFMLWFNRYDNYVDFDDTVVEVSARVVDDGTTAGATTRYEISDITVNTVDNRFELKSGGFVYAYTESELKLGDVISFTSEVNSAKIEEGYTAFTNGTVYYFYGLENLQVLNNKVHFDESVRNKTKDLLIENMNGQNAGIAYSVLFGDKSELDPDIRTAFSYSGIAHILAVSGLHVGFLVALISFVLKKCKVNKYVNLSIMVVVLALYCYLCGFTPSVVRASVMSVLLLFAMLFGFEYDSLSTLSFAGLVILIANPFSLLNVGFQLSFASVFGIITLAPDITNFLKTKARFTDGFASGLAISISTNIAVILISLNYFNEFALLGVFTNLIVLPVFSVAYSLLFVIVCLGLILNFMGALLVVPDAMLHFIKLIANGVSSLPYNVITVFKIGFIVIVILLIAIYLIHFLMGNKIVKRSIVALLTTVVCVMLIVINIPAKFSSREVYLNYQSGTNYALFVNEDDERVLVGLGDSDNNYMDSFLMSVNVNRLDAIVVYEVSLRDVDYINRIVDEYEVKTVMFASVKEEVNDILVEQIKCKNVGFISQNESTEICGYSLQAYYYYERATGVVVSDNDTDTLLLKNRATANALSNVSLWWDGTFENVIVNKSSVENMDELLNVDNIFTYGNSSVESEKEFSIRYKSNFTLSL